MPSAVSETVAYSSRSQQLQRSQSSSRAQGKDTPFALMLEASEPPPSQNTRPQAPTESAAPAPKTEKTAVDPKKKATTGTPEPEAAGTSDLAQDTAAPDAPESEVVEDAVASETSAAGEMLPEMPQADAKDDGSEPADPDVAVTLDATPALPQTPVAPEVAMAAPAAIAPEAPAEAEGEIAVKPADVSTGIPAKPAADAPVAAPIVTDTPDQPTAAEGKSTKEVPDIKGGVELKGAELQTTDQPADVEDIPDLPQAKTEHARQPVPSDEAKLQQTEAKPHGEPQQAAEPAQQKPAAPQMTASLDTDATSAQPPQTHQPVATDVASLTAGNQRATTLMAQTAVPVSGIAVEIAAQARAGNNRFEIRLDPPELGRIDVRLDIDQDGNVKSRLVIERADTYDLLRRDASTLERALQQAGLKTSDSGLEFTLRDQNSAQREARDQNQRDTERGIIPDADILPAEAASGYGRMLGLGTGVDIRI